MVDELFDRTYQASRADLNTGIDRILNRVSKTVAGAFRFDNGIGFGAPGSRRDRDTGCA